MRLLTTLARKIVVQNPSRNPGVRFVSPYKDQCCAQLSFLRFLPPVFHMGFLENIKKGLVFSWMRAGVCAKTRPTAAASSLCAQRGFVFSRVWLKCEKIVAPLLTRSYNSGSRFLRHVCAQNPGFFPLVEGQRILAPAENLEKSRASMAR